MSSPLIIDAGPVLNFLSINRERLLFATLGRISAPEIVEKEVLRKSNADQRFSAASTVWGKVRPRFIDILSDTVTPELSAVVQRLDHLPMTERLKSGKDLGETMVIAHAVVAAEAGSDVVIVMDEGRGVHKAALEARRLDRLRSQGKACGTMTIVGTLTILERAAGREYLPDRAAMRDIYKRLRVCDDGLVPIEQTRLLSTELWG